MINLRSLMVREGQRWTPALWNKLVRAVDERTLRTGRYVRLHHSPDGVTISANPVSGTIISHPWQMSASAIDETKVGVTFLRGMINGVEAKIDVDGEKIFMSKKDDNGDLPVLKINTFSKAGYAVVYAKTTVDKLAGNVTDVELISAIEQPVKNADKAQAFKIIGMIFYLKGTLSSEQHAFFNLQLVASGLAGSGKFVPIWGVAG